ncbi:MAG: hypothetical protein WC880_01040 [Candidatus Paceibacterota bacterium]
MTLSSPQGSQKPKKVLGVDLDDVLIRTGDAMASFHNATYGTNYLRDEVVDYNLGTVWNCAPEETQRRIDEFVGTEFHHQAEAVFGAYDALKHLGKTYEIAVVTGRHEGMRDNTIDWLTKNFLGLYREIHFTGHYETDPSKKRLKSSVMTEIGADLFIDDALHFASDVASVGIPVLLLDTPWNQGVVPTGVTRVASWTEILAILASKETLR